MDLKITCFSSYLETEDIIKFKVQIQDQMIDLQTDKLDENMRVTRHPYFAAKMRQKSRFCCLMVAICVAVEGKCSYGTLLPKSAINTPEEQQCRGISEIEYRIICLAIYF